MKTRQQLSDDLKTSGHTVLAQAVLGIQHQGSLTDQLKELHALANAAGLYDAADWLTGAVRR